MSVSDSHSTKYSSTWTGIIGGLHRRVTESVSGKQNVEEATRSVGAPGVVIDACDRQGLKWKNCRHHCESMKPFPSYKVHIAPHSLSYSFCDEKKACSNQGLYCLEAFDNSG